MVSAEDRPTFKSDLVSDFAIAEKFLARRDTDGDYVYSKDTRLAYLKEYRRLFIFCSHKQKLFADIDHEDAQEYVMFLKTPPASLVGKKLHVESPDWKPFFTDSLSGSSVRSAVAAVKSLWSYMQRIQLIGLSPWAVIVTKTNKVRSEEALRRLRILPLKVLQDVIEYTDNTEQTREGARQRWLFIFFMFTGSRISDVVKHGTGSFETLHTGTKTTWVFNHTSKGGAFHSIPIPSLVIDELKKYRASMGKIEFPIISEALVFNITGKIPVTNRSTIHNAMKSLFQYAANYIEIRSGAEHAIGLRRASTHWLKHSFVKLALDVSEGDIRSVSSLSRHADWKTTKIYDYTDLDPLSDIADSMANRFEIVKK
jgi:Site-specific recombinase XerC